jgi:3-mercaptopyruvate sulfurtransferase SseA
MRLLFSLSAVTLLAVLMLAACNSSETKGNRASSASGSSSNGSVAPSSSSSSGHIAPRDGVKRVTTVELRDALEKGTALVVDVRGDDAYRQSHIKGSISIPLGQVATRLNELPRDKMIVTYCS